MKPLMVAGTDTQVENTEPTAQMVSRPLTLGEGQHYRVADGVCGSLEDDWRAKHNSKPTVVTRS